MGDYLQLILLGVVQGIAEFLPISSSGHLVLTEQLLGYFGGKSLAEGKTVEVMLHLGTLAAIVLVYFGDLVRTLRSPRLCGLLIVATIPAGIVGLTLKDWFETAFDSPLVVGFGLLITAVLLTLGQTLERARMSDLEMPWSVAIIIGCFQALALMPGISRSGSTISGGLLTGVDRLGATRFSFLLAIPVTSGAILLTAKDVWEEPEMVTGLGPLLVGMLVSFVTGWLTLKWLIRLISQRKLHWFAIYCATVGLITLAVNASLPTAEGHHEATAGAELVEADEPP
ncbi:undecaprenyl-diphosphate phosphatase [bacterium]|nr:undecaprenyl-diphosphate phosphatase [bacterium]